MYPERLGMLSATLVFAGFFVTFFPQFLLGNAGMPRRYFNYPPQFQVLHVVSTVGSWVLALGLILTAFYLLWSLRWGAARRPEPVGLALLRVAHGIAPAEAQLPPRASASRLGPYDYTQPLPDEVA